MQTLSHSLDRRTLVSLNETIRVSSVELCRVLSSAASWWASDWTPSLNNGPQHFWIVVIYNNNFQSCKFARGSTKNVRTNHNMFLRKQLTCHQIVWLRRMLHTLHMVTQMITLITVHVTTTPLRTVIFTNQLTNLMLCQGLVYHHESPYLLIAFIVLLIFLFL